MSLGFVRSFVVLFASFLLTSGMLHTELIGDFIDVSEELKKLVQTVFVGGDVVTFGTATGYGKLRWDRYSRQTQFINKLDPTLIRAELRVFGSSRESLTSLFALPDEKVCKIDLISDGNE